VTAFPDQSKDVFATNAAGKQQSEQLATINKRPLYACEPHAIPFYENLCQPPDFDSSPFSSRVANTITPLFGRKKAVHGSKRKKKSRKESCEGQVPAS